MRCYLWEPDTRTADRHKPETKVNGVIAVWHLKKHLYKPDPAKKQLFKSKQRQKEEKTVRWCREIRSCIKPRGRCRGLLTENWESEVSIWSYFCRQHPFDKLMTHLLWFFMSVHQLGTDSKTQRYYSSSHSGPLGGEIKRTHPLCICACGSTSAFSLDKARQLQAFASTTRLYDTSNDISLWECCNASRRRTTKQN